MSGAKATYRCLCCRGEFEARVADRKRGWARYCSKQCKAVKQEARTGQWASLNGQPTNLPGQIGNTDYDR